VGELDFAMGTPSLPSPLNTLHITIRFTASIPDLPLDIPYPSKTTVIYLKHLIRSKLSPPTSSRRLRLIYGGKILPDTALLPSVLKIPPPPPRSPPADPKGKGKAKAIDIETVPTLVFINCSIGDLLRADELAAEASAATSHSPLSSRPISDRDAASMNNPLPAHQASTTPAPRGFDRLLSSGFTPAEVGQLRLQFLSIQASIHTPDTMPSPTTLRRMEDAWIDDNGEAGGPGTGTSEVEAEVQSGALDDLLWGLVIGFLWPLGSMAWLNREDGVWSSRRQTAVWSGFILCLSFGLMNLLA
jgi:DUF2407 C-terminal domain/DUF2407 ubiquitin-like domain